MNDHELSELQTRGYVLLDAHSLADVLDGISTLGLEPHEIYIQPHSSHEICVAVIR